MAPHEPISITKLFADFEDLTTTVAKLLMAIWRLCLAKCPFWLNYFWTPRIALDVFFIAFLSVVGEKEENSNTVNVRTRDNKVHGEKTIDQVLEKFAFLAKERIKDSEDEF